MSDDLLAQAGEYVLGTLDAAERSAFAARLAGEPAARAAVAAWERRLAPLDDAGDEVAPDAATWAGLVERMDLGAPALPPPPVADAAVLLVARLQASRNRWRATAFAAAALVIAVLGVAALLVAAPPPGPERRTLVAAINPGGNKPALLISVDLVTRRVTVRPVAAQAPPGRSLELWAVNTAAAPRSLGLVGAAPAVLAMPAGTGAGTTFAVSVEPEGGSTTGGPTGPVIYAGQLVEE